MMRGIIMKISVIKLTVAIILILSGSSVAWADFPIEYNLNLEQGSVYKLSMETIQSSKMIIESEQQIMEQNNFVEYDYTVDRVDDAGNMLIAVRYNRIKFNSKIGPQVIEYDSDNPPDYYEPATIGFKATVGSTINIEITPNGEILEIVGIDEIINNILADANLPETEFKAKFESDIRNQFGYEATKQAFEQITSFYPNQPKMVGETWSNDMNISLGFPMIINSDYKLDSSDDGISQIAVNSIVASPDSSEPISMGPISFIYEINGRQNGTINVNENSGLPVSIDLSQEYEGTVTASGGIDEPSQTWPISSNSNTLIRFEKQ